MSIVKKTTLANTDQLVSLRMENATHQELTTDVEMSRLGNGPITMINTCHTHQEFCHQLTEESLILVMLRKSLYGLILEILDKLLLSKFMVQINKLL
jgi:hypothetical protein